MTTLSGRQNAERRKAAGVCVRCGKHPNVDGITLCQTCRVLQVRKNFESKRHRRLAAAVAKRAEIARRPPPKPWIPEPTTCGLLLEGETQERYLEVRKKVMAQGCLAG